MKLLRNGTLCLLAFLIVAPPQLTYGTGSEEAQGRLALSHEFIQLFRKLVEAIPELAKLEGHVYACLGRIALTTKGPALLETARQAWQEVTTFDYDYSDLDDYLKAHGLPSVMEYIDEHLLNPSENMFDPFFIGQKIGMLSQGDPEFLPLILKCLHPLLDIAAVEEFLTLLQEDAEVTSAILDLLVSVTNDATDWATGLLWSLPLNDALDPNFDHQDHFDDTEVERLAAIGQTLDKELGKAFPGMPLVLTWARSFWAVYVKLLATEQGIELVSAGQDAFHFIWTHNFNFTEVNVLLTEAGLEPVDAYIAIYTRMLQIDPVNDHQLLATEIMEMQTLAIKLQEKAVSDTEFATALWAALEPVTGSTHVLRFYEAVVDPVLYGFYLELCLTLLHDMKEHLVAELEGMKRDGTLWATLAGRDEL